MMTKYNETTTRKDLIQYFIKRDEHYIFDNFVLKHKGKTKKLLFIIATVCILLAYLHFSFTHNLMNKGLTIFSIAIVIAALVIIPFHLYVIFFSSSQHQDYKGVMLTSDRLIDLQSYRDDAKSVYPISDIVKINVEQVSSQQAYIYFVLSNGKIIQLGEVSYYQKVIDDVQAAIKKSKVHP